MPASPWSTAAIVRKSSGVNANSRPPSFGALEATSTPVMRSGGLRLRLVQHQLEIEQADHSAFEGDEAADEGLHLVAAEVRRALHDVVGGRENVADRVD